MKEPICFLVNIKDLCDERKNPNFSLSAESILKNPKIPKKFIQIEKKHVRKKIKSALKLIRTEKKRLKILKKTKKNVPNR